MAYKQQKFSCYGLETSRGGLSVSMISFRYESSSGLQTDNFNGVFTQSRKKNFPNDNGKLYHIRTQIGALCLWQLPPEGFPSCAFASRFHIRTHVPSVLLPPSEKSSTSFARSSTTAGRRGTVSFCVKYSRCEVLALISFLQIRICSLSHISTLSFWPCPQRMSFPSTPVLL